MMAIGPGSLMKTRKLNIEQLSYKMLLIRIGAMALLVIPSQSVLALTTVREGQQKSITASTPVDSYRLVGTAALTALNATTLDISAGAGSNLSLTGTQVTSTGFSNGVTVTAASAGITASTVTSAGGIGVSVGSTGGVGSSVTISDSSVSGNSGVQSNALGRLTLINTVATGTGTGTAGGFGLQTFDSNVSAVNSTITGETNGVRWRNDPTNPTSDGVLTLDNTHVVGKAGPAIEVFPTAAGTGSAIANINVDNGSTLLGGNGVILDVNANGIANFKADNSKLTGDVVVDAGGAADITLQNSAVLTGRLDNVENLALKNSGKWVMVQDSSVANLVMSGGAVQFGQPGDFYTLSVGNLSGSGTFDMESNFAEGKADLLDVTGAATGSHELVISSSGSDPLNQTSLHVVHIASGDASFSLLGGPVDLGTYSYGLTQTGNDWYLDSATKTISVGTQSVLALFNTAPTVWYGEMTTLRTRMGEVRMDSSSTGFWARTYGNKYDVSLAAGGGYQQTQRGISLGADTPVPFGDGRWLVGLMAGYSKSDLNLQQGSSGTVDSYYAGAYTTWIDKDSGYYFDGVLKFNRFQNKSDVSLSDGTQAKGDYNDNGLGASLEFGRHIKLANDYFVEPFAQISGVVIQGERYELTDDMTADGDRTRSLLSKVGSTVGRTLELTDGRLVQPYVRAAWVHEFAKNNEVKVNDNAFNNDLSGSRGELGFGVAMSATENWQLHADFDYSNGDGIEQPWGANVGLRYSW